MTTYVKKTIQDVGGKMAVGSIMVILITAMIPQISSHAFAATIGTTSADFPVMEEIEPKYEVYTTATAYSSDPWQTDNTPCIPAMGSFDLCKHYEDNGQEDTIATNMLPLGTKVRFPDLYGDKIFVVRDRMNEKYNGQWRVDFWVGSETPTNQEIIQSAKRKAIAFGVKRVRMEVYNK